MKKFIVFAYYEFYPSGGWNDFKGDFDTLEEATEFSKTLSHDYVEIVDTETKKEVSP